jgi:UDP-N-acetylmuramoylalanine--D-glutamate ligase
VIFKSSGIPINEKLAPYQDKITSQVQLFFDNYDGKVIAVTATKGKSTIASLIYHVLKNA